MEKNFELINKYIHTKALKYKALENINKCIDDKMTYGSLTIGDDLVLEMNNELEKRNYEASEAEYSLYKYLNELNVSGLNSFIFLVKLYNKNKEKEMIELSQYLKTSDNNEEMIKILELIAFYEKYEKRSIKDILYIVMRRKADLFGMRKVESSNYAKDEIEHLMNLEILDPKVKVRK